MRREQKQTNKIALRLLRVSTFIHASSIIFCNNHILFLKNFSFIIKGNKQPPMPHQKNKIKKQQQLSKVLQTEH